MVLEWIRRHDPAFDQHLKEYLFTTAPITERKPEEEVKETANQDTVPGGTRRWNG